MKKKIVIVLIIGVVLFALFGKSMFGSKESMIYETAQIERRDISSYVTAIGTVSAVTTVDVGTQVSGTIKEIYVDYNSTVKKGQMIALIDPTTFEAQVEQAKANLMHAKAALQKAKATLEDAQRNLNRQKLLWDRDLIARSELDAAQTNYDLALAGVSEAEANVYQAQAALKKAETDLGYTRIYSPVDGIVVSRDVDAGQTVAASFQTPTLFTIAQDLTKMQIETNVDEADIGEVKEGLSVTFTVDAYPEAVFSGTIKQVRIASSVVENVVTYPVIIDVANPDLMLKPGMTANVTIITDKKEGVLAVPSAALRYRPSDYSGDTLRGKVIWVLEDGKPLPKEVKLGITDGAYVEILQGDLNEGQLVVIGEEANSAKKSKANRRTPF
ncbi:MAG: efflux RND transporter periplasmic adaptor subunit [Acetomicrobium sp.]|uniref:efflux RND transporter periplasmic adaptor subunit n=1 Tax=Acetomicrobium TaxID=49894 RepID=UPI00169269C2|nr:efflux RND transporter periplasmic adaptor subunit [Acetomicrobium mobile]NLI43302.1 efflux RND transporter periplasmic adaptor subunit [Synergistaceae bacterium]HOB10896.1 efflux RND transporter periplasmic adaptor subunit [Acetomicrobium sp.]HQA36196.1 efflux RND transporter periplasmic adaptor subunit [Acetomicrobium sp.]HQC87604.1 efflux RND transporter periplasmic adaptor subunit [Acetomicrobium sp.]